MTGDPYARNRSVPHDTEDRDWWYEKGESLEHSFVQLCQRIGLPVQINPAKEHDRSAPDIVYRGEAADLKTQNTPFFTAARYRMDPRLTVTFNRKDLERYLRLYPEMDILFWIEWKQVSWKGITVDPLRGIWALNVQEIHRQVAAGAPEHAYLRRQQAGDPNAKSSFLLDVRRMTCLWVEDGGSPIA